MKIRNSFICNSSSSSFICVLAEIIDKEKFNAAKLGDSESGKDIEETSYWEYGADWAGVYIDRDLLDSEKEYFYWEEYGGAGDEDYCFQSNPDDWDLDYNVNLENFPNEQQEMFNCATEENGLKLINRGYGAGRNG